MDKARTTGSKVALGAILLVVIAVIVGALSVSLAGSGGEGSAEGPAGGSAEGLDDGSEPTEAPEPVMLGDHPVVQACSLLPLDVVESATEELAPRGYVTQEIQSRSLSQQEVDDGADVSTHCSFVYNDQDLDPQQKESTLLKVRVDNLGSVAEAKEEMRSTLRMGNGAELREMRRRGADQWLIDLHLENARSSGGLPVKGLPGVLYVKGAREFVAGHRNVLVTISLTTTKIVYEPDQLTAKEYREQVPAMKPLFASVQERIADPEVVQRPLPTNLDGSTESPDGVRWLEPCDVLSTEVFEEVFGRPDDQQTISSSLPRSPQLRRETGSEPFTQVSSNSCERGFHERIGKGLNAKSADLEVEIRYAADSVEAMEVLVQHFVRTSFDQDQWDEVTLSQAAGAGLMESLEDTPADNAYLFDTTGVYGVEEKSRKAYFTVGPYEVRLFGTATTGKKQFDFRPHSRQQYEKALDLVAERVRDLSGLAG